MPSALNASPRMQTTSAKRLIVSWSVGLVLGTLLIAVTSPLFVRSYLPQQFDAVRNTYVPVSGEKYRWRSEGYAVTQIGQHGMPGRSEVSAKESGTIRLALWGDSQAEGVCVADHQKLFAQIERAAEASGQAIEVLPLARSGDDASHWLTQIPSVEKQLSIDAHLMVIVELTDLLAAGLAPLPPENDGTIKSQSKLAATLPAFLIQAARHLLTDQTGNRRKLRFSVGTVETERDDVAPAEITDADADAMWQRTIQAVQRVTRLPVVIVYAPRSPHISAGRIVLHDPQDEAFQAMERAAVKAGLVVVDTTDTLANAARAGQWAHGFHNGQIGDGHLNAIGNRVIAEQVTRELRDAW